MGFVHRPRPVRALLNRSGFAGDRLVRVRRPRAPADGDEEVALRYFDGTKERISNYFHAGPAMPLVTVKPKFQVTIPAKLRKGIDLHEGDLMEATIVGDGILLRPKEVVDRDAAADRIASIWARVEPSSEDTDRSENEIMEDIIADIAEARRERRVHQK